MLGVGDLERRTRLSHKTIWLARTGRPVGLGAARKIAKALRVSLRSLLATPDTPAPSDAKEPGCGDPLGEFLGGDGGMNERAERELV